MKKIKRVGKTAWLIRDGDYPEKQDESCDRVYLYKKKWEASYYKQERKNPFYSSFCSYGGLLEATGIKLIPNSPKKVALVELD